MANNLNNQGSSTTQKQWGVTPPIATNGPSERDLQVTADLLQTLKDKGMFESQDEARTREIVLGKVTSLVKEFVYKASIARGHSESQARSAGGKIFTFGSYRLGVHGPGADIDTLCVVPKHVQREDFFTIFEDMLKERDDVEDIAGIPDAYVPIMTCTFSGISIDFLFARLGTARIDEDLELGDSSILKGLDERDQRSLNGSRVTDEILRLIPNVEVFRLALRCIKHWAQRRAIYSNILGFLGGVAWAMLVARICQLYPNEVAGAIVSRFFIIFYQWKWPQPVLLKHIEEGPLAVRVWNPKLYPQDRLHRMPIITPAYPSMCSTHNVMQSTQMVMTEEFKRAAEIVDSIMVGKATWSDLFAKHDFFHRYTHYLQIIASSGTAHQQLKWSGSVESKIRQYVSKLELTPTVLCAPPFVKGFDQVSECENDEEVRNVAMGHVPEEVAKRTKMEKLEEGGESEEKDKLKKEQDKANGKRSIWTTTFFIGLVIEPRDPNATVKRKLDITYPTNEFTGKCRTWDQYNHSEMGIVVRHIKCSELPSYVFEGDEPRPAKASGKRSGSKQNSKKAGASPAKKRKSASASAASSLGGSNGNSTPLTPDAGSNAPPPIPIQPGSEAATTQELQNFKLATGTEPLNSSNNPNDFKPVNGTDPNLQVAQ